MNNAPHADDCIKFLIKGLAKTMQEYKRNPSVGLAYEIGRRQKELSTFILWNKTSVWYILKVQTMVNATDLFVYKFIDKNVIL